MPQFIQRSFTAGEISPSLQSRADTVKYANGLNLCENFFVRAQGGVYSRPGFRFIGELGDSSRKGRLIPFSFNTQQTYILVFEHLKLRVIRNGGYVLSGTGPAVFELVTPYTEAQLSRLNYTQSADVMTITHPDHDPANLSRLADDSWALNVISYASTVPAPVFSNPTVRSITGVTKANPAVVTINSHGFVTGNTLVIDGIVGMTELNGRSFKITIINANSFQLQGESSLTYGDYISGGTATRAESATTIGSGFGSFNKTYTYVVTAVTSGANGSESLPSIATSITSASLSATGGVRLGWEAVPGADFYRVYKDPSNNTQNYGWIGDSNNLSFDDYNIAPITSDAPPEDRQPFNGAGNNPSAVEYYDQRQVFANTFNEPQTVFTTQVSNYQSLRTSRPARDDDAVTFTIAGRHVNEIRHIVSLDSLILLTSGGEWKVNEGRDQVLTPATAGVKIQSYNGSSWVRPVVINNTLVFVQEKGSRIRDLDGGEFGDKYAGNDLSIMSEHLFEGHQIVEMAYADEPYGILWCVRDDGVMLGLTYLREHQVWGWHKHSTDGEFESVATISEDGRDALYAIIKREINGSVVRYVERMEKREGVIAEDSFYVDSGLSYDGPPVTSVSGLSHIEGKSVSILADGYAVENKTVSNGSVILDRPASKIHVGLPYIPAIELLDIDVASPVQTFKAQSVSVSKVNIEVEGSRGGFVGPRKDAVDGDQLIQYQEIKPRFTSDGYGLIELKSYKQEVHIEPQWAKGGGLRIEQRSPLPLAILSVIPQVDIGGN